MRAAWLLLALCAAAPAAAGEPPLRVCADPNNMPFSNDRGEGFENRLAELVAEELGTRVEYTWHAQRRGFIRETLNAGACDVVMGMPNMDMIATTRPYYRSGYVLVSRADAGIDLASIDAPELADYTDRRAPDRRRRREHAARARAGRPRARRQRRGFTVYGDYRQEAPPMRLLDAVVAGEIDVAAAWGPLAGWYAKQSDVPLRVTPITDTSDTCRWSSSSPSPWASARRTRRCVRAGRGHRRAARGHRGSARGLRRAAVLTAARGHERKESRG